jgi:hypothetical protein
VERPSPRFLSLRASRKAELHAMARKIRANDMRIRRIHLPMVCGSPPLVAVQWEMELCWVPLHHSYGFTTTRKAGDVTSYRSVCARILDLVDEELHSSSS